MEAHSKIRVGTSGFQFKDWKGKVYPSKIKDRDMLLFYEKELGFDVLEVNYTYYRLPEQKTSAGMVEKTSDTFEFVVRSNIEMTHEIWEDDTRKQIKDNTEIFVRFKEGLRPMTESGKLGCVLIQFPSFFWPKKDNFNYLRMCHEMLHEIPIVIEFRNKAWVRESTFHFLEDNHIGYCVVDEPQLPRLMPFIPKSTSDIAYIRLHGRNTNWFNTSKDERYNYLYSEEELHFFLPHAESISKDKARTFVFFNNCHGGFAVRNGLMMKKMLGIIESYTSRQEKVLESLQE
ncbi:MAG: DUF72 domain-containing protein [Thermodesulfobacteriota bacterium]|nr:DUF72 domain-containing protein [Thermodesulfobacteriota bacterium]